MSSFDCMQRPYYIICSAEGGMGRCSKKTLESLSTRSNGRGRSGTGFPTSLADAEADIKNKAPT